MRNEMDRVVSCQDITLDRFNQMMDGAVPMDYAELKSIVKRECPNLYETLCLDYPNPYASEAKETPSHWILCHSMVEYFIRK